MDVKARDDGLTTRSGVVLTYSVTGIESGLPIAAVPVAGLVAVTVMVPVQVPAVRLLRFCTATVNDPLVTPEVFPPKLSQVTLPQVASADVTEYVSCAPVLLLRLTVCATGADWPISYGKASPWELALA